MADKIEYSRMLVKRTAQTGEVPTIPPITATTLNEMIPTDLFVGEFFLNEADDLLWIRTDNGILPISLSGSTGSTPNLTEVLFEGNATNGYNIEVSNGDTIIFQGIPSGVTTTILGLDASGNTITTTGGGSQSLDDVLSYGNTTGIFDIVVSSGQTIQYLSLSSGSTSTILGLDASGNTITTNITDLNTYITGGTFNYTGSTGVLELFDTSGSTITITGLTDVYLTGGTYSSSDGELTLNLNDGNDVVVNGFFTGYTSVVESLTTGTGLSGDTTTGNITIINTAPDQVVSLSGGTGITTGGSYPNFTIINTAPDQVVSLSGGTGITTGGSYPNFTITNSLPDQTVVLNDGSNISVSGSYPNFTISATGITDNDRYTTGGTISYINSNGTLELFDNSGNTISITGLTDVFSTGGTYSAGTLTIDKNDGTSFNVSGFFTGSTTPTLSQVLTQGNTTSGNNIVVSTGDTISSPNGENEIFLQSSGNMGLQSIYTLGGANYVEQIKMRAPSPTDAGLELSSYDSTNLFLTKREYRPTSITDFSFDSGGSFVSTDLDYSGFTIDLSNTSAGYLTINGLLAGTATDLLGIDSNNRVVPYTISASTDYYVTGGTFSTSGGTLTLNRQNGSVSITGFTANVGCLGITIDGGGSAITTGVVGSIIVPYACVIDCWGIIADQSGSIVVDVWKGSSPLSIPTSAAQSIAGSEKPTLSSQQINTDLNLTTWSKNLVFGDVLVFNVDSATTVERITLQIKVIKL